AARASANEARTDTRAVWRRCARRLPTLLLRLWSGHQHAQRVDQLGCAHESHGLRRLAKRHVLEQARQRGRAVFRVTDDVELLVGGGEVAGVTRGVEVDVEPR